MSKTTALWILISGQIFFPDGSSGGSSRHVLAAPRPRPPLTDLERSRLRFHLENLWNEMNLLVRNQKSEEQDLRRQEREFALLQVFDRIPFEPRIETLKAELIGSAQTRGLQIARIDVQRELSVPPPPPKEVFTDTKTFHFSKEQLTETLRLTITGKGRLQAVNQWIQSWPNELLRWVEPHGQIAAAREESAENDWIIHARAFRFRDVNFPKLKPRDPIALLPPWAKADIRAFAEEEPLLWSYVTKIRECKPKTEAPYENRRRFFLNGARMSFYMEKVKRELSNTR